MNLRTAVENWLKCHGYDGLYHADTECGCKLGYLMPCDEPRPDCEAGYLGPFVLGHSGYAFGGKEAFRICAHKPAECFADAPAEPKPEPPPVHMTVALVGGRIQVNLDPVEGGGA